MGITETPSRIRCDYDKRATFLNDLSWLHDAWVTGDTLNEWARGDYQTYVRRLINLTSW